ncbi:MAG: hypothetical protein IKB79_01525 [Oscillospiraceae bacterium]|nr:hypothetical protein [Oscillospiraceae bacterium]
MYQKTGRKGYIIFRILYAISAQNSWFVRSSGEMDGCAGHMGRAKEMNAQRISVTRLWMRSGLLARSEVEFAKMPNDTGSVAKTAATAQFMTIS